VGREETPHPTCDGLEKTPSQATLPDFWGPMDLIGVPKSDSPRERAIVSNFLPLTRPVARVRSTGS